MTAHVTDQSFKQDVLGNLSKPSLVDFWAEWCGPCRMMAPVIDNIGKKYQDKLSVFKMDTDANPQTAQDFQITGIPCCILFKDGKELARIVGYRSEDAFVSELKKYISL